MAFGSKISEPLGTKIDVDNVGLAKETTVSTLLAESTFLSKEGKYDFIGWLFANGTVKHIFTTASPDTTTTLYTVPSGKTAYICSS